MVFTNACTNWAVMVCPGRAQKSAGLTFFGPIAGLMLDVDVGGRRVAVTNFSTAFFFSKIIDVSSLA